MILINPFYSLLFLIPMLGIIFYIIIQRRANRDLETFAAKELLAKVVDFTGQKLRIRQRILRIAGLIFLILAICGPGWGYNWQEVKSRGLEIIFALDTSKSMLAADIKPTRLERAKLALKDFLNKIEGNKVGLVAFSGSSFLQCPLTLDYSAFGESLDALSVYTIPRGGTAIGSAIATARKAFQAAGSGTKILILITDGENHEGDPVAGAKAAAQEGITIYTIGIGSPEGELVVIQDQNGNTSYLKDSQGNVVKTTLNEAILKEIAQNGNGSYLRANGLTLGLDVLYNVQLAKFNKSEISSKWQKKYINRYQLPLLVAVLVLLSEFGMGLLTAFKTKTTTPKSDQKLGA